MLEGILVSAILLPTSNPLTFIGRLSSLYFQRGYISPVTLVLQKIEMSLSRDLCVLNIYIYIVMFPWMKNWWQMLSIFGNGHLFYWRQTSDKPLQTSHVIRISCCKNHGINSFHDGLNGFSQKNQTPRSQGCSAWLFFWSVQYLRHIPSYLTPLQTICAHSTQLIYVYLNIYTVDTYMYKFQIRWYINIYIYI